MGLANNTGVQMNYEVQKGRILTYHDLGRLDMKLTNVKEHFEFSNGKYSITTNMHSPSGGYKILETNVVDPSKNIQLKIPFDEFVIKDIIGTHYNYLDN